MNDIRVADTTLLRIMNNAAAGHNLRQISDECISKLDPNGWHVLTLLLWGHNMDHSPILYHRTEVLMKFTGDYDAHQELLDVTDTDWTTLITADTAIKLMRKGNNTE